MLGEILLLVCAVAGVWYIKRMKRCNPALFSAQSAWKTAETMSYVAFLLVAVITVSIMILRM